MSDLDKLSAATQAAKDARIAELEAQVCAYGAMWAVHHAALMHYPDGNIHANHYDDIKAAGARVDGFTRHDPAALSGSPDTAEGE